MALTAIGIRDFAIASGIELDLEPGFTVLTGETGAGKSIIVDALALLSGDRADSSSIRHGTGSAEINASFVVADSDDAQAWLADNALAEGGECVIRRVIQRDKPSRAFINGRPATVQMLRDLGDHLVDIHGQHEHQSLLRRSVQRQVLDDYAGLRPACERLGAAFDRYSALEARHQVLTGNGAERSAHLELLRYQLSELRSLDIKAGEYEELDQEQARLAHASDLIEGMRTALFELYDAEDQNLSGSLARHIGTLEKLSRFEPSLHGALELLNGALVQVNEAAGNLQQLLTRVDLDPQRLEWVQQRLSTLLDLGRKHRCAPEELPALLEQLQGELEAMETAGYDLDALRAQAAQAHEQYDALAAQVSRDRSSAASGLAAAVTAEMQGLGMQGGAFTVRVTRSDPAVPARHGLDQIEFYVSVNPGQPAQPLARVASGGELSRISLAIQVITAAVGRVPTLVFDEVDVGIGGRVAEIVGQKLRALGRTRQVLCVTHLPQVAAQGQHHLQVLKQGRTGVAVAVTPLGSGERVKEIARMLGGVEITDQTLAHAEDMLLRAAS
jgi:DNA repair protein RecN (Recombination protein N)